MPGLLYAFQFTVPAGTPVAAPLTFDASVDMTNFDTLHFHVPPGPNGVLGFRILTSDVQFFPYNAPSWIVVSDHSHTLDITDVASSGSWQIQAYNTGYFDHTIYLWLATENIGVAKTGQLPTLLATGSLSAVGSVLVE